jgi:hypothetical protein
MPRETYDDPGDDFDPPLDPRGGCPWVPGTEGKVAAIEARIAAGWSLWHPDDATFEDMHVVEGATKLLIDQSVSQIVPFRQVGFAAFMPRHYATGKVRLEAD